MPHTVLFFTFTYCLLLILHTSVSEDGRDYKELSHPKSEMKLRKCVSNQFGFLHEVLIPNSVMANNESTLFKLESPCSRTRLPHCFPGCTHPSSRKLNIAVPTISPNPYLKFTPGGFLRIENEFYHRDDYCVTNKTKDAIHVEVCKQECGENIICVPKCCSADKVYDIKGKGCEYSLKHFWKPLLYKSDDTQVCGERKNHFKFHFYMPDLTCDSNSSLDTFLLRSYNDVDENRDKKHQVRSQFRLLQNGSVVIKQIHHHQWLLLEKGKYCLDGVQNYGSRNFNYSGDPLDQVIIVCNPSENHESESSRSKLTSLGVAYCILLFSGTPFLLLTVIVYLLLWNKQNVHGWTLLSHTLAMLLNYTGQGVTNTVSRIYDSSDIASTNCKVVGILNHYFVLTSFCWMTMINYDLWSMFRHLKSTVGRSKGMKRFAVYSVIAWCTPLVVVIISYILDEKYGLYGDDGDLCDHDYIIVPLYGFRTCYMVEEARPYYIYWPIASLMVVNLVLATLTFYNMSQHKQSAKMVSKTSTKHKQKFSVWAKLFVVMGVAYTSEVVVWNFKEKDVTLPWYLVFPDVLGLFQAIAIFILFACQRKIVHQLNETYPFIAPFVTSIQKSLCGKHMEEKITSDAVG